MCVPCMVPLFFIIILGLVSLLLGGWLGGWCLVDSGNRAVGKTGLGYLCWSVGSIGREGSNLVWEGVLMWDGQTDRRTDRQTGSVKGGLSCHAGLVWSDLS